MRHIVLIATYSVDATYSGGTEVNNMGWERLGGQQSRSIKLVRKRKIWVGNSKILAEKSIIWVGRSMISVGIWAEKSIVV